jgi:tetratricopeptide (TPR) repeat protein
VKITGKNAKPNVMLIVDQSSSMDADFGDGANPPSRWNVLRDLLIGRSGDRPAGLVYDLQDQVQFGFVVYSARAVGDSPVQQADTVCPMLNNPGSMNNEQSIISFALNNYTEISGFYGPAGMVDETPTGDAITLITDKIGTPSSYEDPVVFILATDGEPDRCEALNPNNNNPAAQNEAIDAVSSAYDLSIKTFVIAIGNEVSNTHAQAVAAAGQGISPVPPDQLARKHFDLGKSLFNSGRYNEAIGEFEISYRLSKRPPLLYDIFVSARNAGQPVIAADALRRYLKLTPHVTDRHALELQLLALEEVLHEQPSAAHPRDPRAEEANDNHSNASPPSTSSPPLLGYTVTGLGAAMIIGGAVTGVMSLAQHATLDKHCPNDRCLPGYEGELDRYDTLTTLTGVLLIGGAGVLAVGIGLWLWLDDDDDQAEPPLVTPTAVCIHDGCLAQATVRF